MEKKVYAAYSKNSIERIKSSSGGIFALIAHYFLSDNGIVYGVAMDNSYKKAEFIRVQEEKELNKIIGSKYVQACLGNTFKEVKTDLDNKKKVLFTGTGCQVNGLKFFLGKEYNNLYCIDVVCHGVSSPKFWKIYVNNVEKKEKAKLKAINFRCKKNGWKEFGMKETFENNIECFIPRHKDMYMKMFLNNLSLRPSCYDCTAKSLKCSDLSMADFWGIENIDYSFNDDKGISMIILRTKKGVELWDEIKENILYKNVGYDNVIKYNSAEFKSVSKPWNRNYFFKDLQVLSYKQLEKKYLNRSILRKILDKVNELMISRIRKK